MSAIGSRIDRGFTLIEMLAVLAITAMVSALAFPRLERAASAMAAYQARQALIAQLQSDRGAALAGGAPVALRVSDDGTRYAAGAAVATELPPNMQLRTNGGPTFFADGSATPSVMILRGGGQAARITVSPAGAVAVVAARSL